MSELVQSDVVDFEDRRADWLARFESIYSGWCAPGSSTAPNPALSADETGRVRAARQAQIPYAGLYVFNIVAVTAFASLCLALMLGQTALAILAALSGAALAAQVIRTARSRRHAYETVVASLPPLELSLYGHDKELLSKFQHGVYTCRNLDPSVAVVEQLTEAEAIFNDLTVAAAELHADRLDHSSAATANRAHRIRLVADAFAMQDVLQDAYSLRVAYQSATGASAVARAEQFKGLGPSALTVREERDHLAAHLRELEAP